MVRLAGRRLRIGVPADLLALPAAGGHGKVWHRVLEGLAESAKLKAIDEAGGRTGSRLAPSNVDVVLASGHADLPPVRSPLVVEVHDAGWFSEELRSTLDPDFLESIARRTRAAVEAADRVITLSAVAARDLTNLYGLDPARVHAVPLGVDRIFHTGSGGGRELVARARCGPPAPYILFAAVNHPRKNLGALRQAVGSLARDGFPHLLVVAGGRAADRSDSSALEREAAAELPGAAGRVVRICEPSDADLAALMAGADAFCLPSLYEGFGLTALEAMACGAPVVVSDRGSLPDLVGDAGIVCAPTAEGVEQSLRTVLDDRSVSERLRRAGVERARGFTWDRTAQGWLAVLRLAARLDRG